ncbi:MAG TPA: NAD-dependent epimerase/dehydratase family protein [Syntrophobacteraceae bacterium]|nr:NAD-dependent epimerase/dehydratase family protein [Syntrophobacteraceae bacterium]
MSKSTVAILGATSHIAKGLISRFIRNAEFSLHLFTRSAAGIIEFLNSLGKKLDEGCVVHKGYVDFLDCFYDVVINCVGVGTKTSPNDTCHDYFTVTEEYDNMAIGYLRDISPAALYISFSSGAVYGGNFYAPVDEFSVNTIRVNNVLPEDFYGIARINSETKHRAHEHLRIVDLRIFSYFSRYINLADGYFITDLLRAILEDKVLVTDDANIVRDYLHPEDLFSMIVNCIHAGKINSAMDVNSSRPISKREILNYFTSEYGLKYESHKSIKKAGATGVKNNYYSTCKKAYQIGYVPRFSSMDTLMHEARQILAQKPNI